MTHPALSDAEIDRRGPQLYQDNLRAQVETPANIGKQIVINVETGAYEIDDDGLVASRRLLARDPDAPKNAHRIANNTLYTLTGNQDPTT